MILFCKKNASLGCFVLLICTNHQSSVEFTNSNILTTEYKSIWYEDLPACPCSYEEAKEIKRSPDTTGKWLICGAASEDYHYGAFYEVRWAPKEKGKPGQQCTYDKYGQLITSGIAAGSPDKISPRACGFGVAGLLNIRYVLQHMKADVKTWEKLPCTNYLKEWPSNNGYSCQNNAVNAITHMEDLVEGLTCQEVVTLFKVVEQEPIQPKLLAYFHNNLDGTSIDLYEQMTILLESFECKRAESEVCKIVSKAIRNL